jgi:integrase
MPLRVLEDLYWYMAPDGERSAAIARAQRAHRYESLPQLRILVQMRNRTLRLHAPGDSASYDIALDALGPRERRTLFKESPSGLEPLALWVNEDGLPRDFHGWENTFQTANRRIRRLGIADLDATPRMLRHSFAHKWYHTYQLAEEGQFGELTEDDTREEIARFGDAWEVVRRLLGHSSVEITMRIYLEPFQAAEIDLPIAPAT